MSEVPSDAEVLRLTLEVALGLAPRRGVRVNTPRPIAAGDTELRLDIWITPEVVYHHDPLPLPASRAGWEGFTLGLYGVLADPDGPTDDGPHLPFSDHRGRMRVVRLWRQWARHEDSPVIAEQLWLPGFPELCSIRGLERPHSQTQYLKARSARPLLRGVEHAIRRGGRHKLEDEPWDYWREQADKAIELKARGYKWEQVYANTGIPVGTIRRWVEKRQRELKK